MQKNQLKKLIAAGEMRELLSSLVSGSPGPVSVHDADGACLVADLRSVDRGIPPGSMFADYDAKSFPVATDDGTVGFVHGPEDAETAAKCISYAAKREMEKRVLAVETLDKYREINVLYRFAEKMANCLDVRAIAQLVLDEATRLIRTTSASVMLYNEETGLLEVMAGTGQASGSLLSLKPNEGIAGHVFATGRAEIVNDVVADSRYVSHGEWARTSHALICAPLAAKDKSIGIINMSHAAEAGYSAQDLKLLSTLASQAASAIENALLHENRLKQMRIRNNLGRYLSPQVVESIINSEGEVSLSTCKRRVTMLFSDIRAFTEKCEELEPEEIVSHLNEYFTALVSVIFSHQGAVNKFVGDMIVAMFGAPSDLEHQEIQAIRAAISMQKCLRAFSNAWIRDNFLTGIGISVGESVVGNIGSAQHMDYTVIGDEVNIASRLQGLARGGQILVTRSVYDAVREISPGDFSFREFDTLQVKGKKNYVEIYEVVYD